jgi:hypothetical protein
MNAGFRNAWFAIDENSTDTLRIDFKRSLAMRVAPLNNVVRVRER